MAKNNLLSAMGALNSPEAKKIANKADLQKTENKNKGGRKPKAPDQKADKTIRVYTTEDQKKTIDEYCLKSGIPVSTLFKQLLIKEGIL